MIGNAPKQDAREKVIRHYAHLAPAYDRKWDRYTRATLSTLLSRIHLNRARRVLDVGCGTGRLTAMLRENDPTIEVTGLDLSPDMIEIARQKVGEGDGLAWNIAPADELPVDDNSFDLVTCANAFHLVDDQPKALREFHRVLRPDGELIIVDWCREFLTIKMIPVLRGIDWQYRRILTRDELGSMMVDARFTIQHSDRFKATWFWGLMCVTATRRD